MVRSFHDGHLVAYEVNCEERRIKLVIRPEAEQAWHSVVFTGVEGYHFEHDALGNIIYALQEVAVDVVLSDYGAQIAEAYRLSGAPGAWAEDLTTAAQVLAAQGVRGFELSASLGLSGWILARGVEVTPG
ncbi:MULTISPECIES: hypothetical protein [unclassified Bradyrhizobium]|uniref:hypothetical protein n=1 Tax=unclassified Bradyrhizobium TaxID=2631580 RepID=UPI0028E5F603|nr:MULTISPECIES: hypothetical protein [unclassified Bradyrhizobium]